MGIIFGTESTMKEAALLPNLPEYNLPPVNRNSGTTKTQMGQGAWLGGLNVFSPIATPTYSWGRACSCSSGSTWPAAYPSWPSTILKGPGFVTSFSRYFSSFNPGHLSSRQSGLHGGSNRFLAVLALVLAESLNKASFNSSHYFSKF